MKAIIIILFSIFSVKGCMEYKELEKVKIFYEANSRGFHQSILIENKTFRVINKRDTKGELITLTDAQWKNLADLFNKIDLDSFNELKGPTEQRFYDGKPHANITITKDEKEFTTLGFDAGIPPVKIKEFVDTIVAYASTKN
jgi:hypothetical protein